MPVIAAIFPRETQDDAINIGNYMPFIATIIPRETQDFASLQGGRQYYFKGIYILNYTKLNATIFVYCVKFYYLCI
ncbi:unknown [Prevotella sp. CAG:487]|nr:unknown [Prevotella sp. CAG:487]